MPNTDTANDHAYASLVQMLTGHWRVQAIYVAAKLELADHLASGPKSATELAAMVGAHPRSLYRLMRALAAIGLFTELDDQRFEPTKVGAFLRAGVEDSVRDLALMCGEEQYVGWGKLHDALGSGESAFEHAFGTGLFAYLRDHPKAAATFNGAMVGLSRTLGDRLGRRFDFSRYKTVVDLGGGRGAFLTALLGHNKHLRGVVFDLPHVREGALALIEAQGLADRCTAVGGDFFTQIPDGGDLYVLCQTLFNWDDERAAALLRSCRAAVPAHGALLIIEPMISADGESPFAALMDLQMMAMPGGAARTEAEYERLLDEAGFSIDERMSLAPLGTRVLVATWR